MPNWCDNTLEITGPEDSIKKFIESAKVIVEDKEIPLSFDSLYPEPNYEEIEVFPVIIDSPAGNSSSMPDWWNWRNSNWGTKWDLDSYTMFDSGINWATYSFDTAWGPPIELFDKVSADYPSLKFVITYGEPGMWFSGQAIWEDGKMFSHTQGEYESFFPDEAKEWLENE
jgi:hypothetical protein